jgi:hypothetical protein
MKITMLIFLVVFSTTICFADETNKVEKIPIVKTNYLQAVNWYRDVNHQLYNTHHSVAFESIEAEVKAVYANGVLFNWTKKRTIYGKAPPSDSLASEGNFLGSAPSGIVAPQRPIIGYETIFSKDIFVLHYQNGAASGEKLLFRAMQVGTTNLDGNTIELWDYGMPHIVQVVVTNWVISKP